MTALNLFLGGWALFWTFTLLTISGITALTGSHNVALFTLAFASYAYWGGISARLLVVKQLPHACLIPDYQAQVNASLKTLALLSLLPVVFFIPDPTMMAAALGVILTVAVVSVCALFSGFINALLSILAVGGGEPLVNKTIYLGNHERRKAGLITPNEKPHSVE